MFFAEASAPVTAKPSHRLAEQPAAAADVEQRKAVEGP